MARMTIVQRRHSVRNDKSKTGLAIPVGHLAARRAGKRIPHETRVKFYAGESLRTTHTAEEMRTEFINSRKDAVAPRGSVQRARDLHVAPVRIRSDLSNVVLNKDAFERILHERFGGDKAAITKAWLKGEIKDIDQLNNPVLRGPEEVVKTFVKKRIGLALRALRRGMKDVTFENLSHQEINAALFEALTGKKIFSEGTAHEVKYLEPMRFDVSKKAVYIHFRGKTYNVTKKVRFYLNGQKTLLSSSK